MKDRRVSQEVGIKEKEKKINEEEGEEKKGYYNTVTVE